ncbi:hypothetical protein MGH68_04425 [Erysipelothrix sp. D19-032]
MRKILELKRSIRIQRSVHAQYNPNTQTITINNEWLRKYEQIMDAKQAYNAAFYA